MMNTQEIANRLVELIREGDYETAHSELYSKDIISIENPVDQSGDMKYMEVAGMQAVKEKGKQWEDGIEELFGQGASDPVVAPNAFAISMYFDAKLKGSPERVKMEEIAVYSVKDGKIVREEFIY